MPSSDRRKEPRTNRRRDVGTRSRVWLCTTVAVLLVSACTADDGAPGTAQQDQEDRSQETSPGPNAQPKANVRYDVRLRDGGSVEATVQYRVSTGEVLRERVQTPWRSGPLTFQDGDLMLIAADTNGESDSPLLCVLVSQKEEDGAYVLANVGDPLSACKTQYQLGQWPPDDDDPIGNALIRVG
jgi:hypothetical protein